VWQRLNPIVEPYWNATAIEFFSGAIWGMLVIIFLAIAVCILRRPPHDDV
jgi:uncharacterized membrane protein